ncbi:MAG: hypothetical protein ACXQTS_04135 [Candidatus Methanospirareceae archaeon]
MRPKREPFIGRLSIDARISKLFPIRHALIYDWGYKEANLVRRK